MIKNISRRIFAGIFLAVMFMSSTVMARPLNTNPFRSDEEKKLPPVNWIRSRSIDVKHLDIDLRFDWDKSSAIGSTVVTFAPFADLDHFTLDAAMMTIKSVNLLGGGELKYTYDAEKDNDNLDVDLGHTFPAGQDIKVKIEYVTNYVNKADNDTAIGGFGKGLRFIKPTKDEPKKPLQIWSQGESEFNRYWFPSYDTPNDFRTTDLTATVKKPFFVVSNGKLVETKENSDNTRTFHWKMDTPYANYLTSIVVVETTPVEQKFDDIPVYNYGYTNEVKEVAATTKNLPATMKFFSDITGVKYPYPKYSQAFVEDFGGGMENISATTQIEEMIHDDRELLDEDSESLQSHELAHQWFGDYVTCRDWGQIWLNESFATYMQAMWTEKLKGHEEFLYSDVKSNHDQVIGTWNSGDRRPIVTKYYANKDAMFDNYAYPGGGSILHTLRKHLGDKLFFRSLNHYLTQNAHQPVSTEELRIAIEETTGQSMDWFFDQWLYRMGHPIFEVTRSYDPAKKKMTLNVKQTQKIDITNEYPQTAFFQAYVDVEIDNKVQRVWLEPKEENVFTFDSPSEPMLVNFDFEDSLLKEITFDKPVAELVYQMANDKDILGRRWAMTQLREKAEKMTDKSLIVTALVNSALRDENFRIRRAALSEIANIYSPDPELGEERPAAKLDANVEAAVIKLTKDPNSLVRGDAIELLGETKDKKYVSLAMPMLNDRSYTVIDQAALALGRIGDPTAFQSLNKLTQTQSWHGRIASAGFNGLAILGDKRGFDAAFKAASDADQPGAVKAAAISAVGALGKGDVRAYPLIFARFKSAFDSNDVQGMFAGLAALTHIADPRGQEAFDMLKSRFKDIPQALVAISHFEAEFQAAIKK